MEYIKEKKEPAFARTQKIPPHTASSKKQYAAGSVGFYIQQKPDSPAPLLCLNHMEPGIIQRVEHIKQTNDMDNCELILPASTKPTMVFESMGSEKKDADALYQMTKSYTGNTICVFGINARDDTLSLANFPAKPESKNESPNFLRCFSFLWKKPASVGEDKPYKMPFVEARLLVMRNAQTLISNAKPADKAPDPKFIYRWIDADAHDDTSNQIPTDELKDFSESEEPLLGTGTYDWRHNEAGTADAHPVYHAFIEQINTEERRLRAFYYEMMSLSGKDIKTEVITGILKIDHGKNITEEDRKKKNLLGTKYYASTDYTPQAFSNKGYLPGYYLPETTLLMNQAAHDNILTNSSSKKEEPAQDKESMKIANRSGCAPKDIRYFDTLSVTKPLKHEFQIAKADFDRNQGSYFFNANMRAFFGAKKFDKTLMNHAFGSLRQSIFDVKWTFDNSGLNALLDAKRKESLDNLANFLQQKSASKNNFAKIKENLSK